MENHQSECNFLSTVSIFSSPPLAARCPLSPLLPAAAALSFCLPLPSPSPLSRLCVVFGGLQPAARLSLPLSASLCPSPFLYFSLHFLPFLPPPLSFLPSFNYFLHFFVAVLPFSSAVCAFSATNVEFSHPPLRDKLVASPIPLHFPSLSPRSLHLPLSASLRPPPPP